MDRNEFLVTVWRKGIKPIFLIGMIFFCGKFLYNVFAESGTERFVTIVILAFGILLLTMNLIAHFFKSLARKLNSILPESIKLWIRVLGKTLDYLSPIIFGMIIYHFWKEDWIMAAVVLGVLLIQRIIEILNEEKQVTTMSK